MILIKSLQNKKPNPTFANVKLGGVYINQKIYNLAESEGFEPSVQFPIRMFSKHVLSATQATLQAQ